MRSQIRQPSTGSLLRRALFVVITATILPIGVASASDASESLRGLTGRWQLDRDRSDAFEPVMTALEVPWLIRKVAGVGSAFITLEVIEKKECEDCAIEMRVGLETPLTASDFVAVLDGVERPGVDPAGNASLDRYTVSSEGGMMLDRRRTLDSGRSARLTDVRSVGIEPDTMLSILTVWVDDKLEVKARRIFVRAE